MSLTHLAVHRPVTTLMACLIVVLLGWISLSHLTVDLLPEMTYPTISVTTLYEGAGPEEIETLVTRPLERALGSVHGVESLHSSSQEGSSRIRVRFRWETNLDSALSDMRAAIEKVRKDLPQQVEAPTIRRYDMADSPIIYLGMSSSLDPVRRTRFAEHQIMPRLERIRGVARVRVRGGSRREIQVDLDRGKLESLNMGINEVVAALRRENSNQPAGDLEQGNVNLLIRSHGEFHNLDEIAETVVRERSGAVVRVRDIARVVDGEEKRTEITRMNGQPGLLIYVYKQAGANTVEVSDRVRAAVGELNAQMKQAQLAIRMDKSDFVRQAIGNIRETAAYGMGLAVVVLILFLRSFRSTLVIGISMPLAMLATFVLVYFKGFTLNIVSFGGLALGIGLLVDNSIVVLESIFRKRDEGLDEKSAAVEGTHEVASAVVASTLTSLIVFVPLLFIQGMTGIMLKQMAWVVGFSLVCSLLASLTLTPVLTAYWIGRIAPPDDSRANGLFTVLVGSFHTLNQRLFGFLERGYERGLRFGLRHAGAVTCLLLTAFTITLGLSPRIGTEFLPKADEGELRVMANMAPGIQLDLLDQQTRILEKAVVENVHESKTIATSIGGDADDADDWNECWIRLHLVPRTQRDRGIEQIRKELDEKIGPIAGMQVRVMARTEMMLSRMLRTSGGEGDIEVEVRGHDLETAEELADVVGGIMNTVPGLVNVQVEKEDRRPELAASINRAKASLLGISVRDITQTLETTIRGTDATIYREDGDEFNVLVRLQKSDRDRESDVGRVSVATPGGRVVPLKSLVSFDHRDSPLSINRLDQQRLIEISADVEDRDLGYVVSDLQKRLDALPLPDGFSLTIAGDWKAQQESFAALRRGLILAVLLMYMVMASQFESLRDPLLILVTVPLGAIGVILMLVLSETTLNVQSFIGIVMLSGIVVNNAIVLIDYANRLRRSQPDLPLDELIVRAAVRRFRPILMTTLTTILAMLPIALGWGEGGELQAPLARVVIGGLTSGTLITLLAIPLLWRACAGSEKALRIAN